MITIHLGHHDRETEIAITASKSGIDKKSAARVVDIVRGYREVREARAGGALGVRVPGQAVGPDGSARQHQPGGVQRVIERDEPEAQFAGPIGLPQAVRPRLAQRRRRVQSSPARTRPQEALDGRIGPGGHAATIGRRSPHAKP
jgi:hypothetical protein